MDFTVSYWQGDYRVYRSFPTYEQAEQFIGDNALVYPLPRLIREYLPSTGIHYLWR